MPHPAAPHARECITHRMRACSDAGGLAGTKETIVTLPPPPVPGNAEQIAGTPGRALRTIN